MSTVETSAVPRAPRALDALVDALKAAGEPTRLRILATLAQTDLTVGELCRVLGQSQPRVSRHLRLLVEAGLLTRHAEGTSAFYSLAGQGAPHTLAGQILARLDRADPVVGRDADRLASVRAERATQAAHYFEAIADEWAEVRDRHVADETVEAALLEAVGDMTVGTLLDVGTGTGRMLEIFADRIDRGLGIDLSPKMLNVARSLLDDARLHHCTVRHGSVYDLQVPDGSVDAAVLHHVLHFLDQPAAAVVQAARTLGPRGRLLIVDFAPHGAEELRSDHAHRRLGFADDEVAGWCADAGLSMRTVRHFVPDGARSVDGSGGQTLTVTLWVAERTVSAVADAAHPAANDLEVAS